MHLTQDSIKKMNRIKRLNLINSITGVKSGNLIGTQSKDGKTNLAVFSSVVHLGSNPAMLGFILRPFNEVPRHTYQNILETGKYTINHIHVSFAENAHYTSTKFDEGVCEFDKCGLTKEYLANFSAPYVGESYVKLGMKHLETIHIKANNTHLVIGEIENIHIEEELITEEGYLNLEYAGTVGIGGLNNYYDLIQVGSFPYARVENIPAFDEERVFTK